MNCGPLSFADVVAVVDAENRDRAERGGIAETIVKFEEYCRIEVKGVSVCAISTGWTVVVDGRVVATCKTFADHRDLRNALRIAARAGRYLSADLRA